MKSAPTTEMSNQHYEERAVPRHTPKSVGAAARRRVLANIQTLFQKCRIPKGSLKMRQYNTAKQIL